MDLLLTLCKHVPPRDVADVIVHAYIVGMLDEALPQTPLTF
jgi:hypothetical protein